MTTEEFMQDMLNKTKQALSSDCYYSNDELGVTQFIALAVHRDSDLLAESNWHSIIADMDKNKLDYSIERFSHWAMGWIDYLIIDTAHQDSVLFIENVLYALDQYPVYDEEDWSQREFDEFMRSMNECLDYLYRANEYTVSREFADEFIYDIVSERDPHEFDWQLAEDSMSEYLVSDDE